MLYVAYLPQTTIRLWGIEEIDLNEIYQAQYVFKTANDKIFEPYIYQLNALLLKEVSNNTICMVRIDDSLDLSEMDVVFDCQFINKAHHFKNITFPKRKRILDYSSLGHRYVKLLDLIPVNQFIRAMVRDIKFKKKFNPLEVIHWRYSWQSSNQPLTNLLWKNSFLNTNLMKSHATHFLTLNLKEFSELPPLSTPLLLICPSEGTSFDQLRNFLFMKFNQEKILQTFLDSNPLIVVKQHRNDLINLPDKFKINNHEVRVIKDPLSRLLPLETILFAYENIFLLTGMSSGLFAANHERVLNLNSLSKEDRSAYGFMLAQLNRKRSAAGYKKLFTR
jgi:hypothetical protein